MLMTESNENQQVTAKEEKKVKNRKLYPAIIAAVIFVYVMTTQLPGVFIWAVVVFMPIWVIASIIHAAVVPDMRKFLLMRVFIWVVAVAAVFGIYDVKDKIMRHYADEVVEKIKTYSATHGHCPKTLSDIGIEKQEFKKELGYRSIYYCIDDSLPFLMYTVPISGFDTYHYDFTGDEWVFHPD
jgi:hypothetical protein